MATTQPPNPTDPSTALRAELKEWERAFAAANGGRKASRSDIKKVPEIAAKYKEYSRLKSLESKPTDDLQERPKKRKHAAPDEPTNTRHPLSTPRKSAKGDAFTTPSKSKTKISHPSQIDPYDSPSVLRRLFSPSTHQPASSPLKTAIGPTPQRDGKALGLFDLLSESGGSTATPTAERLATVRGAAAQTPSKRKAAMDTILEEDEEDEEESPRMARTPASSGKKFMLSTLFATPTTWRYAAMMEETGKSAAGESQPVEAPLVESETPSFLRRSNSGRYAAGDAARGDGGLSPIAVRARPQFVGKGLSALVQGLRDMEEESMQDDMDVLNEIEAEQAAWDVEVADSQGPEAQAGQPFKKRGQKRTTRMVRMRPVVSRPSRPDANEQHGGPDEEVAAVPETQHVGSMVQLRREAEDDAASLRTMSEPDVDSDEDYEEPSRSLGRSKSFTEKMKEAIGMGEPSAKDDAPEKKKPQSQAKSTEKSKPRERKINPEAHANYRSLKIRSRGSRGRGGRFRRR